MPDNYPPGSVPADVADAEPHPEQRLLDAIDHLRMALLIGVGEEVFIGGAHQVNILAAALSVVNWADACQARAMGVSLEYYREALYGK